jgi:hypothetical protein
MRQLAAISSSKDWLVAYIPSDGKQQIEVNLSSLGGNIVSAKWLDPANGTWKNIEGCPFQNTGIRKFEAPGSNSFGDSDWVLELKTKE